MLNNETLVNVVKGTVLKSGDKYIQESWRRGCFDRDHKVIALVDSIENATVYENGVPEDFKVYRTINAESVIKGAEHIEVTKKTFRNVVLRTTLEIN